MTQPVVLITGCSEGGIGHAFCKQFAARGCRVFATARRLESMTKLDGCDRLTLDVNNAASITSTVEKIIEEAGHIDLLINNAGCPGVGPLLDIDLDQARKCIETNVFGTLAVCRAVAPHMIRRGSGKIVNIGSVVGYAATPWAGVYSMSKAAVHSMSDALRLELAPFGVQVTVVAPGAITSNFGNASTASIKIPEGSFYSAVTQYIYARANMSQGPQSTPTDVFADKVAEKLLRPVAPRYLTFGTDSWIFLLFYYLPYFVKDFIFAKKLGTTQLKRIAQ